MKKRKNKENPQLRRHLTDSAAKKGTCGDYLRLFESSRESREQIGELIVSWVDTEIGPKVWRLARTGNSRRQRNAAMRLHGHAPHFNARYVSVFLK